MREPPRESPAISFCSYQDIDTVPFAPNGSYQYTDETAPSETNWYRLVVNCTDASIWIVPGELIVDLTP